MSHELVATDVHWVVDIPRNGAHVDVQIRYRQVPVKARLNLKPKSKKLKADFVSPVRAVTPGQSAVFYRGDKLLGGGIIDGAL